MDPAAIAWPADGGRRVSVGDYLHKNQEFPGSENWLSPINSILLQKTITTGKTNEANLPVTRKTDEFPGTKTLLSTTDTLNHIGYANATFIRTSGLSPEALMGQAKNRL